MINQNVKLRISGAREKLQSLFPNDPRGDLKLIQGSKVFKLQKAYLRLQSGFFKKKCSTDCSLLEIHQNFQEQFFSHVISCFYGATITVHRSQIILYFPIIHFLQIETLLDTIRKDLIDHANLYNFFLLMRIAHNFNEQEIFEICLTNLQNQNFKQLNEDRQELLQCPIQLFKLVIKTHNRIRRNGSKGLQYLQIVNIIKAYCNQNNLSQIEQNQMKFQLIDKNSLSSYQYKQIFLNQAKSQAMLNSVIPNYTDPSSFKLGAGTTLPNHHKLAQSVIDPHYNSIISRQLTLEMQNTFEKKLNEELIAENKHLLQELKHLKESTSSNKQQNQNLNKSFHLLKEQIEKKSKQDQNQRIILHRIQKNMGQLRNQLNQKNQTMIKMQQKIRKLENIIEDIKQDENEENMIVQSQIIPGDMLKNLIPKKEQQQQQQQQKIKFNQKINRKQKQQKNLQYIKKQQINQQDIQQLYISRLQFNIQPIGTPKKLLPILAKFLTGNQFSKKKLTLIYRRSKFHQNMGNSENIQNKQSLLILIKTQYGSYIGGFISVAFSNDNYGYLEDPFAFIFSLSQDKKFKIKKNSESEAIFISEHELITFGEDLLINNECVTGKNQCTWPNSYQSHNKGQNSTAEWFIGGKSPFFIETLQCYEVNQGDMQMIV